MRPRMFRIRIDASGPVRAFERAAALARSQQFKVRVLTDFGLICTDKAKRYCGEVRLDDTGTYRRSIQHTVLPDRCLVHDGVSYGRYLEFGTRPHKVAIWKRWSNRMDKGDLTGFGRYLLRKARIPFARLQRMGFLTTSTPEYRVLLTAMTRSLPQWRQKIRDRVSETVGVGA